MVSGITSGVNAGYQFSDLCRGNSSVPQMMAQPSFCGDAFVSQAPKKKSWGKALLGTIGAALVVAGSLFALGKGVQAGKLTKVDNATKFMDKAKNIAFDLGSKVANSKVFGSADNFFTKAFTSIKNFFNKKGAASAQAAQNTAA